MRKFKSVKHFERCNAQDSRGKRCTNRAVIETDYHGNPELYAYQDEPEPTWVRVFFCNKHKGR